MWTGIHGDEKPTLLTHWGRANMGAVLQITYEWIFECGNIWSLNEFHWRLRVWVQLTTRQHWIKQWLDTGVGVGVGGFGVGGAGRWGVGAGGWMGWGWGGEGSGWGVGVGLWWGATSISFVHWVIAQTKPTEKQTFTWHTLCVALVLMCLICGSINGQILLISSILG